MQPTNQEAFFAKLDAFAETLAPDEQEMLAELIDGEAEVLGFNLPPWPGVASLIPEIGTTSPFDPPPRADATDFSGGALGSGR